MLLLAWVTGEAFAVALAVATRVPSTAGDAIVTAAGYLLYGFGPIRLTVQEPAKYQAN